MDFSTVCTSHGIAAELNRRGSTTTNGDAWDAQRVMYVIGRGEMIRSSVVRMHIAEQN